MCALSVILFLCILSSAAAKELKFHSNGTFKIVVFADLHYGENGWEDWGPEQDRNSDKVMSYVLDVEEPDFVVYLGDLVTANNVPTKNASAYWKQALAPSCNRSIPWATVFGNHDDLAFEWPLEWFGPSGLPQEQENYFEGTTRAELLQGEMKQSLSKTKGGPQSLWPSVSNFHIPVLSSKSSSSAALLYFLDSGGGSYPEVISAAQSKWFQNLSHELNPHNKIQEMMFWHIPSIAYASVAPKPLTKIVAPCVGSINLESVASQSAEWGIMDVLTNRTSIKAVIVGHNHGLDWCCPQENLWLCYARHTGYGGYGYWMRGARVIELSEHSNHAKTWIRLEDGSVSGAMKL